MSESKVSKMEVFEVLQKKGLAFTFTSCATESHPLLETYQQ